MAWRRRRSREERLIEQGVRQAARTPQGAAAVLVFALVALLLWGGWQLWEHYRHRQPAPVGAATTQSGDFVRIATWNLRKFSERDQAGEHPPDLVAIAQII